MQGSSQTPTSCMCLIEHLQGTPWTPSNVVNTFVAPWYLELKVWSTCLSASLQLSASMGRGVSGEEDLPHCWKGLYPPPSSDAECELWGRDIPFSDVGKLNKAGARNRSSLLLWITPSEDVGVKIAATWTWLVAYTHISLLVSPQW